ncbi:MAG TPA: hypothetical protein VF812_05445 [Ktedonobacterales bacterium]
MDDQQSLPLTTPQDAPDDGSDAPSAASPTHPELPAAPTTPDASTIEFLTPPPSTAYLLDAVVYRPGALVALALLAGPVACAIAGAVVASVSGAIPVWVPFILLLWIPVLGLTWALLKSVRVAPDSLACGRALSRWRTVSFGEIERVEQRGLRMRVSAHSGPPLLFTPLLLHRGAELRRSLLLQLPLPILVGELRAEALSLTEDEVSSPGDIQNVLTVRPRLLWPIVAGFATLALLAAAIAALIMLAAPLSVIGAILLFALAGMLCFAGLWTIQDVFVSEKGLIVHYSALRQKRDIVWEQACQIAYAPGEMALVMRGARLVICAGPGLLRATQARQLRRHINRYCLTQVVPLLSRQPRQPR